MKKLASTDFITKVTQWYPKRGKTRLISIKPLEPYRIHN